MLIGYNSRHGQNTACPLVLLLLLRVLLAGPAAVAVTAEAAGGAGVSISRQIKMWFLHLPVQVPGDLSSGCSSRRSGRGRGIYFTTYQTAVNAVPLIISSFSLWRRTEYIFRSGRGLVYGSEFM